MFIKVFIMREIFVFFCLLFFMHFSYGRNLDSTFQIIPQPQSIEMLSGKGINYNELKCVLTASDTKVPILGILTDGLPRNKRVGKSIFLQLTDHNVPVSAEGYVLEVCDKGVKISASSDAGLFYGCQTLEQLMEDSRDFGKKIPAMKIIDYPAIPFRAVHLDTKHHLDCMEYYYRMVDKLSRYKINAIVWEIEDKLRFTRRPEIGASNAISKQEMQAICRYAKERNIEITPLVQGLGHAGFILKHHWKLRENPLSDWEFCPANPETYEVLFDLYLDAMEAMPYSKYIHIGGDEITAIGIDERCKSTGKSPFELQMEWLQKVCKFITDHGRIPIFWDDMPLKYAGLWDLVINTKTDKEVEEKWDVEQLDKAITLFPKECVYMRWNYRDATTLGHRLLLDCYSSKGLKVMGATCAAGAPFLPRKESPVGYIYMQGFTKLIAQNHLEGVLATSWEDGSPHLETVMRTFIAQGEFAWNPLSRNIETFKKAHAQREYGFKPEDNRMSFLEELEQAIFFFDKALISDGRRNPGYGVISFTLIDLPDKSMPGKWSETYAEKIKEAKREEIRYDKIKKGLEVAKQEALRNRYTLDIYEQINNMQYYPTRLIIALNAYDVVENENDRKSAIEKITQVCADFDNVRSQLISVYSKTRFMEQPDDYISDMNHHNHLSAKTNNSDWIFFYEIPMVQKIKMWLSTERK